MGITILNVIGLVAIAMGCGIEYPGLFYSKHTKPDRWYIFYPAFFLPINLVGSLFWYCVKT